MMIFSAPYSTIIISINFAVDMKSCFITKMLMCYRNIGSSFFLDHLTLFLLFGCTNSESTQTLQKWYGKKQYHMAHKMSRA